MNIELRISGVVSIRGSLPELEQIIAANIDCGVSRLTVRIKASNLVKGADQEAVISLMGLRLWKYKATGLIKEPIIRFEHPYYSEDNDSYELIVVVEKAG